MTVAVLERVNVTLESNFLVLAKSSNRVGLILALVLATLSARLLAAFLLLRALAALLDASSALAVAVVALLDVVAALVVAVDSDVVAEFFEDKALTAYPSTNADLVSTLVDLVFTLVFLVSTLAAVVLVSDTNVSNAPSNASALVAKLAGSALDGAGGKAVIVILFLIAYLLDQSLNLNPT
jgi:hypothetical protein